MDTAAALAIAVDSAMAVAAVTAVTGAIEVPICSGFSGPEGSAAGTPSNFA